MTAVLRARIERLIDRLAQGGRDDAQRDALIAELAEQQSNEVEPYRRFLANEARRPAGMLPALPTDVFRFTRVAAHAGSADLRIFRSSGTTAAERGTHAFADLSLYDRAAAAAARYALFADQPRHELVVLAPDEREAPDSSLSYMLARFVEWFGTPASSYVWRNGALQIEELVRALTRAEQNGTPVALLGTSFAFVHANDALGARHFALPAGSRIMQTGGFKGRSRSVEPEEMLAQLSARYGLPPQWIVQEYGMTELSSQLYETTLRQAALGLPPSPRRLWVPGWVRAQPVDPQTLLPVAAGSVGVLRIDDLANVGSVCSIQTSDLARSVGDGIVVLGRAQGALPRGCSITADEWLSG